LPLSGYKGIFPPFKFSPRTFASSLVCKPLSRRPFPRNCTKSLHANKSATHHFPLFVSLETSLALPNSLRPSITIQHHHDIAFHNRYVGIGSTGPPTNQHSTTLLKCLTTGEPPSLFDIDRVTYAPGAPPSAMLGIPDQMG